MKVIVTGSRELALAEPFYSQARELGRKVAGRKRAQLGRELTAPELADAYRLADTQALTWVRTAVHRILDDLHRDTPISLLVHGGAQGVDRWCGSWAADHGVPTKVYRPRWMKDGVLDRSAGYRRNWWMLFSEAGPAIAEAHRVKTGTLAQLRAAIQRESEEARRLRDYNRVAAAAHDRELLADVERPDRREVLQRFSIPVPQDVVVHAFWDGESRGTSHAVFAARTLGYDVQVHRWERHHLEVVETDRARIDHRPGDLPPLGEGRRVVTR